MTTFALLMRTLRRLEPWVAGIFFFYFLGVNVPPFAVSALNALSYPVILVLLGSCWRQVLSTLTVDLPLLLLHLLGFGSILWSAAPEFTGDESKTLIRAGLFGVYLAVRFGLAGTIQLIRWPFMVGAIASFLAGAALPSYGVHLTDEWAGSWKGVFIFKNLFASQMVLSCVLFVLLALGLRQWRYWGLTALSLLLLVLSRGKTAMASLALVLYLLPLYFFIRQQLKLRGLLLVTGLLVTLMVTLVGYLNLELIVVDFLGKNLEFNGRLPIWTLMLEKGMERFWLGYGYTAFWTSHASDYILTHTWAAGARSAGLRFNAHNGYIDLFLQLGFVGLACFFLSFIRTVWQALRLLVATQAIEFFWILLTLFAIFLVNLADSLSIASSGSHWSLYVACAVITAVEYQQLRKAERRPGVGANVDEPLLRASPRDMGQPFPAPRME